MSLERLQRIDSRWIFIAIIIAAAFPILYPIGLPMKVSDATRTVYETIDSVPPGGLVIISADFSFMDVGEMEPMFIVFLRHLVQMDVKIVTIAFYAADSAIVEETVFAKVNPEQYGKTYGVDYVHLGFIPGHETAIAAFADDVKELISKDYYGNSLSELPIMEDFNSAEDIDLAISMTGGSEYPFHYIRQWYSGYGVTITGGARGLDYASMVPYIASGQLTGFLASLRGAAEYELLTGYLGDAIPAMDSHSLIHVVIIITIVLGNIGYLASRSKPEKKGVNKQYD